MTLSNFPLRNYAAVSLEAQAIERSKLIAAGYKPQNHPVWITLDSLLATKQELHEEHHRMLLKYIKT